MADLANILRTHDLPSDRLCLVFSDHQAPIYALPSPQSQTLVLWQQLRAIVISTGYWPLIIGNLDSIEDFRSLRPHQSQSWRDILHEAQQLDPVEHLLACENQQRRMLRTAFRDFGLTRERPDLTSYPTDAELEHYLADYYIVLAIELGEDPNDYLPADPWSNADPLSIREAPMLAGEDPNCLLLVPTTESWQVPAYLYLRDGSSANLVRMLHRWQEHYGAELVAAGASFIELYLAYLPQDRAQARRFAWEMGIFAPEPEGMYDMEKHAAQMLQGQRFWSLWWD